MLSSLNSKLRRRHTQATPITQSHPPLPKPGAQRTTKHAQKLKLLPNPDDVEDQSDHESGRDVYSQFTRIKDPTARRDAARLGKDDRAKLPRVTAYCTANAYKLEGLMKFLRGRGRSREAAPKLYDECVYTPYRYSRDGVLTAGIFQSQASRAQAPLANVSRERRYSDSALEVEESAGSRREELNAIGRSIKAGQSSEEMIDSQRREDGSEARQANVDIDIEVHIPEIFLFNYGTVVIWGMTLEEEHRFLKEISKFEQEKLGKDDVQEENFNFYYTREYQARIYNDFISLREKTNYMTKLAISHALSQSVKVTAPSMTVSELTPLTHVNMQTSLYEDLVDNTIDTTKDIPSQLASSGKTGMSGRQIAMQIGELFILRINIHLQGSVLDSPELMWAEPRLEPVYTAVRSYLELDARCTLLTERLDVIADLLAVLKDQSSHRHGEFLEWIVIILIAAEIFVAAINIVVDLYAGVD